MTDGHTQRLESALAGRYKVQKKLGEGGMATVYLAEDIKHERKVALKILKPELAAVIGAERFLAEIKTTANLQHPHILPLFDSGESDGYLYYVMPFIDGETLRDKLDREKQLGVDEAVRIATSVADALDYAHRQGVIHRDIKPANILLHDGRPIVADFGIAVAISAAGGGRMTETGLSLGTPHYMSPEQASADRDLSARSDVYSLGCVLYEMIAGQPPHTGPSAQSILVRILTESPRALTELRHTVPAHVSAVVMKSIEKLPADRFDTARQVMDALADVAFTYTALPGATATSTTAMPAAAARASGWDTRSRVLGAAVVVLAGLSAWLGTRPVSVQPPPVVSFVALDSAGSIAPIVGPNGELAYILRDALYVRAPGALEATVLHESTDLAYAAFSPDGAWVGFLEVDESQSEGGVVLRKMPSGGGPIATLWSGKGFGARLTWAEDERLYFSHFDPDDQRARVVRVSEVGGEPEEVFAAGGAYSAPYLVDVLPGAEAGLLHIDPGNTTFVVDLGSGDTTTVITDGFGARWSPTGHLIYEHESGALWAVPFDPKQRQSTGPPAPVLDGVAVQGGYWNAFALSRSGTLMYRSGEPVGGRGGTAISFHFVSPEGERERIPIAPSDHADARVSPDGSRIVYTRENDLWVFDLDLGTSDSLTAGQTGPHNPVWSPDGDRVAYRGPEGLVWARPADRREEPTRMQGTGSDNPAQWIEGDVVLFANEGLNSDVFALSVEEGASPRPVLQADWSEEMPSVSPDGGWIAYVSARSGTPQLYVRTWPDLANEVVISEGEAMMTFGNPPLWAPDGSALFYVQAGRHVAASIKTDGGFEVVSRASTGVDVSRSLVVDIAPDGRFLVADLGGSNRPDAQAAVERLVVVTNWFTELRARLGAGNR